MSLLVATEISAALLPLTARLRQEELLVGLAFVLGQLSAVTQANGAGHTDESLQRTLQQAYVLGRAGARVHYLAARPPAGCA